MPLKSAYESINLNQSGPGSNDNKMVTLQSPEFYHKVQCISLSGKPENKFYL